MAALLPATYYQLQALMNPYAQQIIELYKHPLNFGKTEDADIIKIGMNLSCGDQVSMYIKLKSQNSKVKI